MNYFAHGRRFLDNPYFVAGTAVPDWLSVVDRKVRVRDKHARPFVEDADPRVAAIARGVLRHHADDAAFHVNGAFYELSAELTSRVRDLLPGDQGFRPSFLGHILVELLLDDALIARERAVLDHYYTVLGGVDPMLVEQAVNRMAVRSTDRLAWFIERFLAEQFLSDYADDERLLFRLNQVMRRVNLPALPNGFRELLPAAREMVQSRCGELIAED